MVGPLVAIRARVARRPSSYRLRCCGYARRFNRTTADFVSVRSRSYFQPSVFATMVSAVVSQYVW